MLVTMMVFCATMFPFRTEDAKHRSFNIDDATDLNKWPRKECIAKAVDCSKKSMPDMCFADVFK